MPQLTREEVIHLFDEQLPAILDEHPELEPRLYHAFLKAFARKEEVAAVGKELVEFRAETQATGIRPGRVILAIGSIYSNRAEALRAAGFEVIEPEEDVEEW